MDLYGPEEFVDPMPILPLDVVMCDTIPHTKWITRCMTLRNKAGMDVSNGVYENVDPEFVINMDRKPLSNNQVAVEIVESLCEDKVPSSWM